MAADGKAALDLPGTGADKATQETHAASVNNSSIDGRLGDRPIRQHTDVGNKWTIND